MKSFRRPEQLFFTEVQCLG